MGGNRVTDHESVLIFETQGKENLGFPYKKRKHWGQSISLYFWLISFWLQILVLKFPGQWISKRNLLESNVLFKNKNLVYTVQEFWGESKAVKGKYKFVGGVRCQRILWHKANFSGTQSHFDTEIILWQRDNFVWFCAE